MANKKTKGFPAWAVVLIAVVVVLIGVVGWGVSKHNGFVKMEESVNKDAAQIETQLQRRLDLIPNLVSTVKGYAAHEEEVFTAVADARAKLSGAINSGDMEDVQEANNEVDSALSRLLAIAEAYPDLKANTNFIGLQDELAGTENRINQARQTYNEAISDYNKAIRVFPSSIIAGMGGFTEKPYFEAAAGASEAPVVEF